MPKFHPLHTVDPDPESTYCIRRYLWRSFLTFLGPLAAVAFFVWICLYFIQHPPVNDIVESTHIDGNWVFYAWFLISVLMLDWARTGLANIEACALMDPRFAPTSAMQLMWHTDGNWANPLWWLRAMHSLLLKATMKKTSRLTSPPPGGLWFLLSFVTLLLFTAIPLSGLAIQTAQVQSRSNERASIFGPDLGSFAYLPEDPTETKQRIRQAWQSGRETTPRRGGLLYAPVSAKNVSATYFDDEASLHARVIETFVGPAVREQVVGLAWGVWANVSCNPVAADKFLLIKSNGYNDFAVNFCTTNKTDTCDFRWLNLSQVQDDQFGAVNLPCSFDETAYDSMNRVNYSMIVAADGYTQKIAPSYLDYGGWSLSPYAFNENHDNCTMNHFKGQNAGDITTASLEFYLWQSRWVNYEREDPVMQSFLDNTSEIVRIAHFPGDSTYPSDGVPWAGFGIHCDVESAVGFATVDPARRQFSNFTRRGYTIIPGANLADFQSLSNFSTLQVQALYQSRYVSPLQMQALSALTPNFYTDLRATSVDPSIGVWRAIHQALKSMKTYLSIGAGEESTNPSQVYPLLTPEDLQESIYKILGETLISYMDERPVLEHSNQSELYQLHQSTYIVAGVVPWQYVVVLLGLWAGIVSGAALWMLLLVGPRWAPTLDGFEMFKFGARYAESVDEFRKVDFQGCSAGLMNIPGMVGLLPGFGSNDPSLVSQRKKPYLIGLSEVSIDPGLRNSWTEFTFDRKRAATGKDL